MKVIKQIYKAGDTLLVREYPRREKKKGQKRNPKTQLTSEEVWKNNLRYAIFNLTIILNHNFTAGDWHIVFTYDGEPGLEEANKYREKMLDKLRRECRKAGIENYKWVMTTEYIGQKLHHHMIITEIPKDIIKRCWPHGYIFFSNLWENPNRKKLASYLLKQASKLYQNENKIFKRRYNCSRNIEIPEPTEKVIKQEPDKELIEPEKGYYIDGEVEEFEHVITRLTCREYVEVSNDKDTKIKCYLGRKSSRERINYTKLLRESYREKQIAFENLYI